MTTKEEYLKEVAEELHKPVKKTFHRSKVIFHYKNETWCLDIADMSKWSKDNSGYKYILVCIDGYTRYAWAEPMKTKTAEETANTFSKIMKLAKDKPKYLWTDSGKEFLNSKFQKLGYSEKDGTLYSTYSESKSVIVERLNRTLKTEMWKRCYELQTLNWIDILQDILKWYNTRKHSTLGMTPTEALKKKPKLNILNKVQKTLIPAKDLRIPKFELGDMVRVSRTKGIFEKGYAAGWTVEQFKVIGIIRPNNIEDPIMYRLADESGEPIKGSFYTEEMQKVKYPEIYLVDEVLKERKTKSGGKEYYISWVGYPSSFNSWITHDQFKFGTE